MRTLFIIPLVLMSLLSFPSWGLTMDDLVQREGLYYKKFTDVPFTGEVEGQSQGKFKHGKKEGFWIDYYKDGNLFWKGEFRNGKKEGPWVYYLHDGNIHSRGVYQNDRMNGYWEYFLRGKLHGDTGTYKNGVKVRD